VPLISQKQFDEIYGPTLRPIVLELWRRGRQTLFYAEGKWGAHLKTFAQLPEKSIVFHVDRDDIFAVKKALGNKFCISGGIPNYLLAVGTPAEVREYCRKVIEGVASDGGYIMDASAIVQDDAKVENIKAMTDATREYGAY
jgi:uroporphyrinogen-III decarboxylase